MTGLQEMAHHDPGDPSLRRALLVGAAGAVLWAIAAECATGVVPDEIVVPRSHASPEEVVLTPVDPNIELQAKTGQPVLFENETLWLMSYRPALAPVVGMMARDLYGVDYANDQSLDRIAGGSGLGVESPAWLAAWRARARAEWRTLGQRYRFRLVLAPSAVVLDLPVALRLRRLTLFEIG